MEKKNVLLGVTGGIAAFKAAALASLLSQRGLEIRVVMTRAAREFVGPLTFAALTGNPVAGSMFDPAQESSISHIELAQWADVVCVAPATANFLAKAAHGLADDLLSTLLLATRAPLVVAPAMNPQMYQHPTVKENLDTLARRGACLVGPDSGLAACGDMGQGRLSPVEEIAEYVYKSLTPKHLTGVKVLITGGPTREHMDPVRFLSNPSSGRMGVELAKVAWRRGADVTLVLGSTHLPDPVGVKTVRVVSCQDMQEAVNAVATKCQVVVKSAAVSDYRPSVYFDQKVKKRGRSGEKLELVCTPDILADLSRHKEGQILVGFAAETEDIVENARAKLFKKQLDLLVANDVTDPSSGFAVGTNLVRIITTDGRVEKLPLLSKEEVSERLWNRIERLLPKNKA